MYPAVKIALAYLKPWINAITEFGEITVVRLDDIYKYRYLCRGGSLWK